MTSTSATTHILFVGNSFSSRNDLPGLVAGIAASVGRVVETSSIVAGGASLRRHFNAGAAARALADSHWDFVVLQEQSTLPVKNPKRYHENVRALDPAIRASGATTVLYLTWARRAAPESQQQLTDAVMEIGREIDARIAPVGIAWQALAATHPDIDLYAADGSHPSMAGSFLAASVLCRTVFGDQDFRFTPSRSTKLDPATIDALSGAARQTRAFPRRRSSASRTAARHKAQGQVVTLSAVVALQHCAERRLLGRRDFEQGHAGPEFDVVRRPEDVVDGLAGHRQEQVGAALQPRSQHRMLPVGDGFVEIRQAEVVRGAAASERAQLREDAPHPVAAFCAGRQFFADGLENGVLCLHETIQRLR